MTESFFQERFKRNLKFYEGKTPEELWEAYENVYGDFELKDIYLAELTIISKALTNEKKIKNDINFDEFISDINKLYSQIESMNKREILENEETIKMIIVAAKLSLNSPAYFIVDVQQLKNYDLNQELSQFIKEKSPITKIDTTLLKEFKKEMEEELEKKAKFIENDKQQLETFKEQYKRFEDSYWKMNDPRNDIYGVISVFLGNELLTKEAKAKCLNIINEMVQNPTPQKVEEFNRTIANISFGIKKRINDRTNEILSKERYSSLIRKVSQCIDTNGNLIQGINDELIEECVKQIKFSKLDSLAIQLQILKEQTRIAKRQQIAQIIREIETKSKELAKRNQQTKTREKEPIKENESPKVSEQLKELLESARKIVDIELNDSAQEQRNLSEIETLFVEELQNESLDKNTLERIIVNDADSDLCRIKFITYGLKYQLDNISEQNKNNAMNLIYLYVSYYEKYKKSLIDETQRQQEMNDKINTKVEMLTEIQEVYHPEKEMFEQLSEEKLKYLNSYLNVELETDNSDEIRKTLETIGIDLNMLSLYKSYVLLNESVNDLLEILNMMREEEIQQSDMDLINSNLSTIRELLSQFNTSKKIYEESKKIDEENPIPTKNETEENILIFFETEDKKTQVEERVLDDNKKVRYSQADVNNLSETLERLRTNTPDDIIEYSDDLNKLVDTRGYKVRKFRDGQIRLVFLRLNSGALKTDKPVYLVITAGKKANDDLEMYECVGHLKGKVIEYEKKLYEKFENATPIEIQEFFERQKKHEENIMDTAQNGRGELHGTKK